MSIAELVERIKHAVFPAQNVSMRPERRSMYIHEMDEELVVALAAANVDHLDQEPRSLAKQNG